MVALLLMCVVEVEIPPFPFAPKHSVLPWFRLPFHIVRWGLALVLGSQSYSFFYNRIATSRGGGPPYASFVVASVSVGLSV